MLLQDLKNRISNGSIPNLLIFVDDNSYQVSLYTHRIAKALKLPMSYYGSIEEAIEDARVVLADDCLYIVTLDGKNKTLSKQDKFDEVVGAIKALNKFFIIIVPPKTSTVNKYKDNTIEFNKQTPMELTSIIEKTGELNHFRLTRNATYELIKRSDCDLGVVINTLEQLKSLGKNEYDVDDIPSFDYRKGDIFTLINKIIARDKDVWEYASIVKDSPSVIAYNLYTKAREKATYNGSNYYISLMRIAEEVFRGISDGTIKDTYALQYIIYESNNI